MINQVLWTIDNELDGASFERLCVDLLYRNGYRDIVPVEPQDGGRDAEELPRRGRSRAGEAAFFQFSLENNWKAKLHRDARRLADRGMKFSALVFVTSQKARQIDVDVLATELREVHDWKLVVYSREWLRFQLEEAHPDLSKKYLNVDVPPWSDHLSATVRFGTPPDERLSTAWAALDKGAYERAVAELRDFLDVQPESDLAWQALAWSQYRLYHYDEALASINRSLKLKEDRQSLSYRACIIAEKGIEERNKAALLDAKCSFEQLLESARTPTWDLFYNIGNVLSALGEHQKAIVSYQEALKLEIHESQIWKNLAWAYHVVGDHNAEMACFDKALEIDPLKPETLVSKAISLLVDFQKPVEAAELLENAVKFNSGWVAHWPQIWYWLGDAHYTAGSLKGALQWIEEGLSHQPGSPALKRLKSKIFMRSVAEAQDTDVAQAARRFWAAQITEEPLDYEARSQLVRLEAQEKNESEAWRLLDETFELIQVHPVVPLRISPFSIDECVTALEFLPQYAAFRGRNPVADYWNPADPLYDLPFVPPMVENGEAAFLTFFAIPFGLGVRYLETTSGDLADRDVLIAFFDVLRREVERAVIQGAGELSSLVPSREEGTEVVAKAMTDIIMFVGLVGLREFSRQRGWIATQFGVSLESLNSTLDHYDEAQIMKDLASGSFLRLNEKIHLLPDNN